MRRLLTLPLLLGALLLPALASGQSVGGGIDNPSASGGGGTVNSGTAGQITYYGATGTTVSGSSKLSQTATGVVLAAGAASVDQPALYITQTWNGPDAAGARMLLLELTDDNGGGGNYPILLTVNGEQRLQVTSGGAMTARSNISSQGSFYSDRDVFIGFGGVGKYATRSTGLFAFSPDGDAQSTPDTAIRRAGPGFLEVTGGDADTGALIELNAVTAPAAPASGKFRIYVDVADGVLKARGPTTITPLASP